ncbi:MAG: glutamate--cysteine ligase [Pseudomonadales bacterium]
MSTIDFAHSDWLKALATHPELLRELGHGIEKESLRVAPNGALSAATHPQALGSALTHPHITTDFSEAQLELITGVHTSVDSCLAELDAVHRFVLANIGDELLWPSSMPCILGNDEDIPLGRYGSSNIARVKTIYRSGLGHRYGRLMQTISGIHYNFSLPERYWTRRNSGNNRRETEQSLRTRSYFDLIRNFRRYSWLLIYLFGASPAVCKSFVKGREHNLSVFDEGSLHLPYGTSLRMGRLGYQSDAQADLHVSYNSLEEYAETILDALTRPHPAYQDIGVYEDAEGYRQLNDSIIQIENEFYGAIRPKQPITSGERPLLALKRRGVAYVEVRCMDLNPFELIGIGASDARFLDTFLLFCLLADSAPDSPEESAMMQHNQQCVVERGREPGLMLETAKGARPLAQLADEILDGCAEIAALQDRAEAGAGVFFDALQQQRDKVVDAAMTPSAQVLAAMAQEKIPFFRFAMHQAEAHRDAFEARPLNPGEVRQFEHLRVASLQRQTEIEAADSQPFEAFLQNYLALSAEARG